ncbi:hypothetical protein [Clostridium perfringens]|uniref:hypothetical protein n=1 Tax=Clostridium perfringens TaxID=1502 RepID=UPI00158E54D2|nr:hypothetical protein [Clostridium perfringens]
MLQKLAIRFISWNLRRQKIDNLGVLVHSDGHTFYKRNKRREQSIKETISKIK